MPGIHFSTLLWWGACAGAVLFFHAILVLCAGPHLDLIISDRPVKALITTCGDGESRYVNCDASAEVGGSMTTVRIR